ncbi:MAG: site-2 protease family protein [Anaerolineales bacterium]|nr:site-2 protease family protein [Anaerolineales bacterium]
MSQSEIPEEIQSSTEILVTIVKQFLVIDHLVLGKTQDDHLIEFEGLLNRPSQEAYDFAASALHPHGLTPYFRISGNKHKVILKKSLPQPPVQKNGVNLILFLITFASIIFSGIYASYTGPETLDFSLIWPHVRVNLGQSFAFAVSLLSILTAHEFGHYFAARIHNTKVTLPFFIPFPISPFGTMGAFIRLLEPPKNKRVLLDIGLAGPIAGLVITIPILIYGLTLSTIDILPSVIPVNFMFEGNSILYLSLKYLVHGSLLPEPLSFQGIHPVIYWIRYFFTGLPLPNGGTDVLIHPVAWAGWAGILITSLNLIPAGQLDGGHLIYSLFGDKLKWVRPVILGSLVILGFMWSGWWLWAFLILLLGRNRAEPLDEITELDPVRKILARMGFIIFFLVFSPVPLIVV